MEHMISDFVNYIENELQRHLSESEINVILDHFNANHESFVFATPENRFFLWTLHADSLTSLDGEPLFTFSTPVGLEIDQPE